MPDMSPEARAFRKGFTLGIARRDNGKRPELADWLVCVREWRKYRATHIDPQRDAEKKAKRN